MFLFALEMEILLQKKKYYNPQYKIKNNLKISQNSCTILNINI